MEAMVGNQQRIPIFTGKNYDFWSVKMRTFLLSKGLLDAVETMPEKTEVAKLEAVKDASALSLIQQAVADAVFPCIMGATSAKEAWDRLRQEFQTVAKGQMPGLELVEVFAVRVKTERPCDLYGTIKIDAPEGSQYVYKKEREESKSIDPTTTDLLLDVPREPIQGCGNIDFEVDLKQADEDVDDASVDEEFCKGLMSWDYSGDHRRMHDELLTDRLEGKNGSVEVCFCVFSRAVAATVKVMLIGVGKNRRPYFRNAVHGRVTASTTLIPGASKELFSKEEGFGIVADRMSSQLQICKAVVAAPWNSTLYICADLWEHSERRNAVRRIAMGTTDFAVHDWGKSIKFIFDENHEKYHIVVEVYWRC